MEAALRDNVIRDIDCEILDYKIREALFKSHAEARCRP